MRGFITGNDEAFSLMTIFKSMPQNWSTFVFTAGRNLNDSLVPHLHLIKAAPWSPERQSSHLCGVVVGKGTDILRWHFSRKQNKYLEWFFFSLLNRKTFLISPKKLSTFVLLRNWLLDIACSLLANLIESLFSLVIASWTVSAEGLLLLLFFNWFYLFIWLHWVLVTAWQALSCREWDPVSWPGIEPRVRCIRSPESQPLNWQGRPWGSSFKLTNCIPGMS